MKNQDIWPALTDDAWESMTVELLNEYLGNNDVNARNISGWTPLMVASMYNSNKEVVQMLIDNGADVNARDEVGNTALEEASRNSTPEVIQVLIDARADVNARDEVGSTPLMGASWRNTPEVIQVLLDNGADLHVRAENGSTALSRASFNNNNRQVIQLLIDNGADVNAKDQDGDTALMVASRNNRNPEVIEFLINYTIKEKIEVDWTDIWKLAKENEDLKGTPVYWKINELRFNKDKYE